MKAPFLHSSHLSLCTIQSPELRYSPDVRTRTDITASERGRRLFNNRRQTACCRRPIRNDSSFQHRESVNLEAVSEITRGCKNAQMKGLRNGSLSYYLEGGKISKVPSSARSRCYSSVRGRRRKLGLSRKVEKPHTMQKQFGSLQTLELWREG